MNERMGGLLLGDFDTETNAKAWAYRDAEGKVFFNIRDAQGKFSSFRRDEARDLAAFIVRFL